MREEPWGSHQEAARALKCATSEALTEEYEGCDDEDDELFEPELEVLLCHLRHDGSSESGSGRDGDGQAGRA